MDIRDGFIGAIGNTPLIKLQKASEQTGYTILGKAEFLNPGVPNSPLSVGVIGNDISVSLGTDATGALSSTAAQVVAAINSHPGASALVVALTYRGNAGAGIVQPRVRVNLSDFLSAPASVERGPFQQNVLRIGKTRTIGPVLRIDGQDDSEITGPGFSPKGDRLYFSSQRALGRDGLGRGVGITYEGTGPFRGAG